MCCRPQLCCLCHCVCTSHAAHAVPSVPALLPAIQLTEGASAAASLAVPPKQQGSHSVDMLVASHPPAAD